MSSLVDSTALIFTEQDIYRIGGYLAEAWDINEPPDRIAELVGLAIRDVLELKLGAPSR